MLSKAASNTIFWVFGTTRPRIEPGLPDHWQTQYPLYKLYYFKQISLRWVRSFNVKIVLFQAIQFSISTQFCSIWPIDRALSSATTPNQNGPGSDGNEGVLRISQSSSITGASPSDCLMSYLGLSLRKWGLTRLQRSSRCILQPKPTGQFVYIRRHVIYENKICPLLKSIFSLLLGSYHLDPEF